MLVDHHVHLARQELLSFVQQSQSRSSTKTVSTAPKSVNVIIVIKNKMYDKISNKMQSETKIIVKKLAQTMKHLNAETLELALCSEEYLNIIKSLK